MKALAGRLGAAVCLLVFVSVSVSALAADPALTGTWINQTALDAARAAHGVHVAAAAFSPATELTFAADSNRVTFGNQMEQWVGTWRRTGPRRFEIAGLFDGGTRKDPAVLQLAPDNRTFTLRAPGRAAGERALTFARATTGFAPALNAAVIAGRYRPPASCACGPAVTFRTDGTVRGITGYTHYAVCVAGDCASMTDADSLTLSGKAGTKVVYYRFDGDRLELRSVRNTAAADEKPSYVADGVFLRLRRRAD
jgi:hypothetical protein